MLYDNGNRKYEIYLNKDEFDLMELLVKAHYIANNSDVTDGDNVNELPDNFCSTVCRPIEKAMREICKDEEIYMDWVNSGFDYAVFNI